MTLQIVPVKNGHPLKAFLRLPQKIFRGDPHWIPPLEMERRQLLNPKKNPFFKQGEAQLFLAYLNGEPVGRISAQIHQGHLQKYQDACGFFGFFESVEDAAVANALITAAQDWLAQKGMRKIRGPFNLTMYDNETGILIEGFDTSPVMMMGHNPPYYASLLEKTGFQKIKDIFAWHYQVGGLTEIAHQLAEATRQYPGLTLRSINMKNFAAEIRLMMSIYNEAWEQNWGFIPTTEDEIQYIAKMLKPIVDPEMAFFAFVNGEPAAFSVSLPNINEAIRDLNGKLLPFGWVKLLWRLKRGLKSVRVPLMGIRKPYRGTQVGVLSVLMNVEMHRRGTLRGYQTAELSWTLEDNEKINKGIELMGGKRYKTYRIYEKSL